jgi:hypothetical protein
MGDILTAQFVKSKSPLFNDIVTATYDQILDAADLKGTHRRQQNF